MVKIFVSYSSIDKPIVRELSQDISDLGHTVWMDQQLTGGQEWWDHILEEIRGCDVFAAVLSDAYLKSEAARIEYNYAIALQKTLLPIRLNNQIDMDRVPSELLKRQIVDYGEGSKIGIISLHKSLVAIDVSGPLPISLPNPPDIPISYLARILSEISHPEVLNYDEQNSFLYRLRDHLRETGNAAEVKKALDELNRRKDLYARVKEEMDRLYQELEKTHNTSPHNDTTQNSSTRNTQQRTVFRPNATGPLPNYVKSAKPIDKGAGAIIILCFLIPLIGLILYFIWKGDRPKSAKQAGIAAIIGAVFYMFINIISNAAYY